jgi:CRP-like cAMP-binding protein
MIQKIKTMPLLAQLSSDKLEEQIADNQVYLKSYTKGMTVYNQKDRCEAFDIVLSGSLVAYALFENGSAITMFEFTTGQMLGANLLFGDIGSYPFTIYCMSDAQLLHITKKAVFEFLHDFDFTMQFIGMLSLNSNKLNRKITMVTQKTLRENLLEYLKQQSILQDSRNIVLPISKKQLADYLGVQRPSLFRELKKLKDEGIIDVDNRRIFLHHVCDFR